MGLNSTGNHVADGIYNLPDPDRKTEEEKKRCVVCFETIEEGRFCDEECKKYFEEKSSLK